MTALVAVIFPYATTAEAAAQDVLHLDPELSLDASAVATVSCDDRGDYRLTTNHPGDLGDDHLIFWYLMINTLVLLPASASLDALGRRALARRLTEAGIDLAFQRAVLQALRPGTSALFLRLDTPPSPDALASLERFAGSSYTTDLSPRAEGILAQALYAAESHAAPAGLPALHPEAEGAPGGRSRGVPSIEPTER